MRFSGFFWLKNMSELNSGAFYARRFAVRALGVIVALFGASRANAIAPEYANAYWLTDFRSQHSSGYTPRNLYMNGTVGQSFSDSYGSGMYDAALAADTNFLSLSTSCYSKLYDLGFCRDTYGTLRTIIDECGINGPSGGLLTCAGKDVGNGSTCKVKARGSELAGYLGSGVSSYVDYYYTFYQACSNGYTLYTYSGCTSGTCSDSHPTWLACSIYSGLTQDSGYVTTQCKLGTGTRSCNNAPNLSNYIYTAPAAYASTSSTMQCESACSEAFQNYFNCSYIAGLNGCDTNKYSRDKTGYCSGTSIVVEATGAALIDELCNEGSAYWAGGRRYTYCNFGNGYYADRGYYHNVSGADGSGLCQSCQTMLGAASGTGLESGTFTYTASGTGYGVTDCHAQRTGSGSDASGYYTATETCNGN